MSSKLSLNFTNINFNDFISKIQDLSSIEDVVKIKIERDNILMYSMLSNDVSVLALKSYLIKTSEYIENFDKEETYDFIITSAAKFVKNLKFFNTDNTIKVDLISKPLPDNEKILHVRAAQFSNGKLKISCIGAEEHKIRDINNETLESRLNIKNSKWGFKISSIDFLDVKKLCSINNEDRILNISIVDGVVTMNEPSKWELQIDNIEPINANLIFGKKYLSNVNSDLDYIYFNIFETFILIKDQNSNLMLSFEQTFEDDDVN
jgi:hypothetical protein